MSDLAFLPWVMTFWGVTSMPLWMARGKMRRRLGESRNREGKCGRCDQALADETFLVHGIAHCEVCAARAQKRLTARLWLTAGAAATAPAVAITGFVAWSLRYGLDWWQWYHGLPLLGPAVIVIGMTGLQLRSMRQANERVLLEWHEMVRAIGPGA